MISAESVQRACSEVGEYSDQKMVGEFDNFFRQQPAVCEFVVELTQESGQKIQELSLFLSYMVFKAATIGETDTVNRVTPEAIELAYHESESWIDRISQADGAELQPAIAASLQADTEPFLLQYVISELNEPLEDGSELNDEQKGEIFFVLKTVISSLESREKGRIIEIE